MRWILPVFILLLASCGNKNGTENGGGEYETPADPKNWYKRYSGTVAGQAVMANIRMVDGELSGSYYYQSQGKLIGIRFNPDTAKPNVYNVDESPEESAHTTHAQWEVTLSAHEIAGMWKDAAGNKVYDIMLKEDTGPVSLRLLNYRDTLYFKDGVARPYAIDMANLLLPTGKDENSDLINKAIVKFINCDSTGKTSIEDCLKKQSAAYALEYQGYVDTMSLSSESNNQWALTDMRVAYNDKDWLVFEILNGAYTGGAHGNYGSSFLNLDLKNNKVWQLEDVLAVEEEKLGILLTEAARKRPQTGFHVDTIPSTTEFYLTHKGISFCYSPYEIASFGDGLIKLFIPYSKLNELLTPAFKQRMGLTPEK